MSRNELMIAACCGVALVAALGGCATNKTSETGVRIGDETLKQFEAGTTTESWLIAVLGAPTSWSPVAGVENTSVYRYATGSESSGFLSSLTGSSSSSSAVVYFIISDGIVTRYWADRAQVATLLGGAAEAPSGDKREGGEEK